MTIIDDPPEVPAFDSWGPTNADEPFVEALPEGYADRLDLFLDDVSQDDAVMAMQAARLARSVEHARSWAVVSDDFVRRDAPLTPREREAWVLRAFATEIATRLHLSLSAAERLIAESEALVRHLPATLEAVESARISYRHAQVIIDQAQTLPREAWAEYEEAVLDDAAEFSVPHFRRRAVRARERMHPESIVQRTREATAKRRFGFEADADGMAWLHLLAPAARASAAFDRVDRIARSLQGARESRTLEQLRADVATVLLIDGKPDEAAEDDPKAAEGGKRKKSVWGIRPTVFVTVPVMTLLGKSDEPAVLDGYGPIDPETARDLAAHAPSFIRLLTHTETGVILSMGKTRYKVPKDLRLWLQKRDADCRSPWCDHSAFRSDIDHTEDWAKGGATDAVNLACLCDFCHRMKHLTTWTVTQGEHGVLEWTSPTGRKHITHPAVDLPTSATAPAQPVDPDAPPPF
ncbi:DUF222 domain-containing protein [Cryobacterium tepidiphilum]|uniref:DUF222 domain-containing protein n=1 Tax=Cryobacterium tepidiphilum TaxID=2486026 RepID=A0A3M8KUL2_9MICO|nr:DUF222 domain-containing protein [Cryobacterium tepidiphilum]RNE56755.1 DUF222 domain-containing protein [Cryobacterium tepidiphilum]